MRVKAEIQVSLEPADETKSVIEKEKPEKRHEDQQPGSTELREPWTLSRFNQVRSGSSDVWILDYMREGWLVREHRHSRKMGYHPVHKHLPVLSHEALQHERITLQYFEEGGKRVLQDDWRNPLRFDGRLWKGYTFVRVNQAARDAATGSRVHEMTVEHAERDGDFEFIDP